MHTTQHSILEDSEETGAEGAAEGEAENTGPEATAERQRLWLCIVSTLFSQQLLVCLLHRQGRQLESHCFLGMNILRVGGDSSSAQTISRSDALPPPLFHVLTCTRH
jgi:hypothetical protein